MHKILRKGHISCPPEWEQAPSTHSEDAQISPVENDWGSFLQPGKAGLVGTPGAAEVYTHTPAGRHLWQTGHWLWPCLPSPRVFLSNLRQHHQVRLRHSPAPLWGLE